jgi:hypothetical protein
VTKDNSPSKAISAVTEYAPKTSSSLNRGSWAKANSTRMASRPIPNSRPPKWASDARRRCTYQVPTRLPTTSPLRNTASMMENEYTAPTVCKEMMRAHTTS